MKKEQLSDKCQQQKTTDVIVNNQFLLKYIHCNIFQN